MKRTKKGGMPLAVKIILMVIAVVLLSGIGIFVKMQYEQSRMTPLKTGEILEGVYAVNNGFVNFYILRRGDEYLMIDAGNSTEQTEAALNQLGIQVRSVKVILLTHSDGDHVAALSLFPEAQIYLPDQEVQMIDGTTRRSPMGRNHFEHSYMTLEDGQNISLLGFEVECIATPGHTLGSMSFLLDGQYLFAGDTMSFQDGKADTFNAFYNMDDEAQRVSIRKLAANTQPKYIFTGHYGYTQDIAEAFQDWH